MTSNIDLITFNTTYEGDIEKVFNFDRKLLKRVIDKTKNETELSHLLTSSFGLCPGINCRLEKNGIDILLNTILIEVKFNHPLTNKYELARALAQSVYYLHNIYEDCKELPNQIYIIENTGAVVLCVDEFVSFIESTKYAWYTTSASNPDKKLVNDLRLYISNYEIVRYSDHDSFVKFTTKFAADIHSDGEYNPPIYYDSLDTAFQRYIDKKNINSPIEYIEDFLEQILYDSTTIWHTDRIKIEQNGSKVLASYVIKKILQQATDTHVYATDMEYSQEMLTECAQYIVRDNNILVVATIEFLLPLVYYFGRNAPNLYFATPSDTKAGEALKLLKKENVWLYERDYDIKGVLKFMSNNKKEFDFVIGNVPWTDGIDIDFLIKIKNELLTPTGTMAIITSAGWLSGNRGRGMRSTLSMTGNVKRIWTYPSAVFINPDTQKAIKSVGAGILFTKGDPQQKEVALTRYLNTEKFDTTTKFDVEAGVMLYIGDNGNNKPKIHFSSKLDLNYFGAIKPLGDITGSKLLTGVQLDLDGTNPWIPELKIGNEEDNAAKRFMLEWNVGDENMAKNASYHVAMRVWGILLGMTNTISHSNTMSLGRMPYDILCGEYDNVDEYETAYYESKNLTAEMIHWVNVVGQRYDFDSMQETINLKNDTTVCSITRSTERVKETGEVFTHKYYIDEILDTLVTTGLCDNTKNVIEPSCGDGNFVLAIIERKIENGMSKLDAISTTWGCDIMNDNVGLCQQRILDLVGDTDEHRNIVYNNIIRADFFSGWDFGRWERAHTNTEIIGILPPPEPTTKPDKEELVPIDPSSFLEF